MSLAGCCCCSLRQGCLIFAYIQLVVISLWACIYCVRGIVFVSGYAQSTKQFPVIYEHALTNAEKVIGTIVESITPIIIFCHFTVVPFINGVKNDNPNLMYPWLVILGVTFIFSVIMLLITTIISFIQWGFQVASLIILVLITAWTAYELAVVVSYYQVVKNRNFRKSSQEEEEIVAESNL